MAIIQSAKQIADPSIQTITAYSFQADPFIPRDGFGNVIIDKRSRIIIRLDENKVLKWGELLHQREIDNLKFVGANTTLPVPRVYEVRQCDLGLQYIMDYMPGKPLEKVWHQLTHDQKLSTFKELGGYIAQLKKLTNNRIESGNNAPVVAGRRTPREAGPFDTVSQFNDFLVEYLKPFYSGYVLHYARACLGDDYEIHFTHGDIGPGNVLVDDTGHVTAILDWEKSGWFPEYWEHITSLYEMWPFAMRDWREYVQTCYLMLMRRNFWLYST